MTLTEFLLARIAEDEDVARGAIDPERPGVHWQWVTNETDVAVVPGDEGEALENQPVSLRTIEEFPTRSVGPLPAFAIHQVDEALPGALRHIAHNDPARVIAECKAKRRIVAEHGRYEDWYRSVFPDDSIEVDEPDACIGCGYDAVEEPRVKHVDQCVTLRALALPYADHPDYREEWRA